MTTGTTVLYVIRHAQASIDREDYDQLSELGYEQARSLGASFAHQRITLARVMAGPRRRHSQTVESFAKGCQPQGADGSLIAPVIDQNFDEHPGQMELFKAARGALPKLAGLSVGSSSQTTASALGGGLKVFQDAARRWVRGELTVPGVESWGDFRRRVESAVFARLQDAMGVGQCGGAVALFTSGGPVGAIVGAALGLNDEASLELSWSVRNAAWSELHFRHDRLRLVSFNCLPAFEREGMITML